MKLMKHLLSATVLAGALIASAPLWSQEEPASGEHPMHQELRQLRDGLLAAMNGGDLEAILPFLHTNCVITWHNAEVSRGHAGVRDYYNRVMTGPDKIVDSFHCSVQVDELTILYGNNMGISFGSSEEDFQLANGQNLHVHGRWTATLVKENDRLLVAGLHASTNLFGNVMLDMARKTAIAAAVVCLLAGLLIGWLIGRRRRRAANAP